MYYVNNAYLLCPDKNSNQKVVDMQAVGRGANCYVKISLIYLEVSAIANSHSSTVP